MLGDADPLRGHCLTVADEGVTIGDADIVTS